MAFGLQQFLLYVIRNLIRELSLSRAPEIETSVYATMRVRKCECVCVFEFSDSRSDEPSAKQAKLDDVTDISGGLPSMLKTKITEVLAVILLYTFSFC